MKNLSGPSWCTVTNKPAHDQKGKLITNTAFLCCQVELSRGLNFLIRLFSLISSLFM